MTWNVHLTKTAGLCYYSQYVCPMHCSVHTHVVVCRIDNVKTARIELSTKVCTDFGTFTVSSCCVHSYLLRTTLERLRDVLIHELCHAATWVIDGVKCGHGLQWKNW